MYLLMYIFSLGRKQRVADQGGRQRGNSGAMKLGDMASVLCVPLNQWKKNVISKYNIMVISASLLYMIPQRNVV